jgi:hypothetical protein
VSVFVLCAKSDVPEASEAMFYSNADIAGYEVFTVAQLLLNGKCCGNACRHCPYNHENVPEDKRKLKAWNGAFYV